MGEGSDQASTALGHLHRTAFEDAGIGLLVVEAGGGRIAGANPHLCDLLGHERGSLAGCPLSIVGETGGPLPSSGVRRWRRADGSPLDVRIRLGGDPSSRRTMVVEAADADDVVRAEENRAALTAAGLGEWRLDFAEGVITLSRRAAHILGYPPGPSATWSAVRRSMEAGEAARIERLVRAAIRDRLPFVLDARLHHARDGAEIRVLARGQATGGTPDAPVAMVGVIQDVTTRVEARNALRDSEQRLRIATSLADLGIFEWHMLDDQAIWENDRMFTIFGRAPEAGVVGKREFLDAVLHPDDRKTFRSAISTALREDTTLQATGRIRRASDGAWRVIDMAGRFERDPPKRLPRRLIGVIADVTERRVAEERRTLLIRELHHRVKNTLATVQAIVGSTARTASSIESFYEAFVGRIMSLAHTHSVLTEDTWQTASLRTLLASELNPYAEGALDGLAEGVFDGRIRLDGPAVDLSSEIAVPIGMAIHELTTNAAKYGALATPDGRVAITWRLDPDGPAGTLHLSWIETGGPQVPPPTRQGFGSRLLQRVLTAQVRAEVAMEYPPDGFRLTMVAPLPARNDALNPLA